MKKKVIIIIIAIMLLCAACITVLVMNTGLEKEGTNPAIFENTNDESEEINIDENSVLHAVETGDIDAVILILSGSDDRTLKKYRNVINDSGKNLFEQLINQYLLDESSYENTKEELITLANLMEDTQSGDKYTERLDELVSVKQKYLSANSLFDSYNYGSARTAYEELFENDVYAEIVNEKLGVINDENDKWDSKALNQAYDSVFAPNMLTQYDGKVYFPYEQNNVYMIVSYDVNTAEVMSYPITKQLGAFRIGGINVAADKIFFVAGSEVGSGYTIENAYNIYCMDIDGSNLRLVKKGHYFDLVCCKDVFYAMSYTEGLVEFDRYFENPKVLCSDLVVDVQPSERGLYYTVRDPDLICLNNTIYLYDGNVHRKIASDRQLEMRFYDDMPIHFVKTEVYTEEVFSMVDYHVKNGYITRGRVADFCIIDSDKMLFSKMKTAGVEAVYMKDLDKNRQIAEYAPEGKYINQILGVSYPDNVIFIKSDKSITIHDEELNVVDSLEIPSIDNDMLKSNMEKIPVHTDSEFFLDGDGENVIFSDGFWQYKSSEINISIEQHHDTFFDTMYYVADIRTKDDEPFKIGYNNCEPPGMRDTGKIEQLSRVNKSVFAINGDFFAYNKNEWSGIVIRRGEVYKDLLQESMMAIYPNGELVTYQLGDDITPEQLLADGVEDSISFGPVLLEDYKITESTLTHIINDNFNQRCGIGMIEPGHYIVIFAISLRFEPTSLGVFLPQYATLFAQQGCSMAYNFDGGQSANFSFMGQILHLRKNTNAGFRKIPEVCYFGTSDLVSDEFVQDEYFIDKNELRNELIASN